MKKMICRIKKFSSTIKKELFIYRLLMKDKRTPLLSKILLAAAVLYLLLPFDLIPDFIPVFGQIDDIIIIPALVFTARTLIPKAVINEYREKVYEYN